MNSRWSYLMCGLQIGFAFVGALAHSMFLLIFGTVMAIWNWYAAEARRKLEEEEYGQNNEESK